MKDAYRERLKKIIGKKFDTTMIYPLGQFEEKFGHFWGAGKPEESLTQEEKDLRDVWKECRNNILNIGNKQKRNANAELDLYTVIWNRYTATLLPIDKYNGNH